MVIWLVLIVNEERLAIFTTLNDEQTSNWLGVERQPVILRPLHLRLGGTEFGGHGGLLRLLWGHQTTNLVN